MKENRTEGNRFYKPITVFRELMIKGFSRLWRGKAAIHSHL